MKCGFDVMMRWFCLQLTSHVQCMRNGCKFNVLLDRMKFVVMVHLIGEADCLMCDELLFGYNVFGIFLCLMRNNVMMC